MSSLAALSCGNVNNKKSFKRLYGLFCAKKARKRRRKGLMNRQAKVIMFMK